ncbi:sigma-70 family RNA polymerase sigma factor [Polyangium sp. 6x1]|uniref:RNA polymerase sigma factor n=1 Tax=Polyangium sp. 6x1 TaxID=3042689 RepID=UPI002482FCF5|nr:sigma-70 family RNA polymerase sigma factor [Polyangium sp. 6x1]MDI1444696.1 sigma-70 family RNA polymerase sigma factor [Polyangium sp. 6x1]
MGPSRRPSAPFLDRLAELLGYHPEISRIVMSDEAYTRDSAEDQIQRVFHKAYRRLPDYEPHPDGMKPWLMTITRNVMSDAHRDTQRHERVFEPDDGHADMAETPEVSPERAAELKQAMEKLTAALRDMPPSQAAVLWMVCVEERSHEEAGVALGISEDAAKMALSRARENLRARFGNTLFTVPSPVLALLSDCVHLLGHLWAFLMALLFASFALSPREPDGELHAVATGVARVVAASAADVAHAAEPVPSFDHVGASVLEIEPPTPKKQRHTPRRPRVDSDKEGVPSVGLSADMGGSSGSTSF